MGNKLVFVEEYAIAESMCTSQFFINEDKIGDPLAMGSSLKENCVFSNMKKMITVLTAPLSFLLEKHNITSYACLSVDAEGCDMMVLTSADLDNRRPCIICVEDAHDHVAIKGFLQSKGYRWLKMLGGSNSIYVEET